jgi:hypothetical protein
MIVTSPDLAENTINFLPRYYDESGTNITVYITNEDTRRDLAHNLTAVSKDDGFFYFTTDADFRNNVTYRLKVVDNSLSMVIFRGKIFATTQSKQNYLING